MVGGRASRLKPKFLCHCSGIPDRVQRRLDTRLQEHQRPQVSAEVDVEAAVDEVGCFLTTYPDSNSVARFHVTEHGHQEQSSGCGRTQL